MRREALNSIGLVAGAGFAGTCGWSGQVLFLPVALLFPLLWSLAPARIVAALIAADMNRSTQIKAMASETRMTVVRLLAEPQQHFGHQWSADPVEFGVCMTLIAEALAVAQPTASRHLEILKQAGFITVRRRQKWSYCKRDEAVIEDYLTWLKQELTVSS